MNLIRYLLNLARQEFLGWLKDPGENNFQEFLLFGMALVIAGIMLAGALDGEFNW